MTRVLLVAHQYWPTPGAATQVLQAMVRALRAAEADVTVLTCSPPAGIDEVAVGPSGEHIRYEAGPETTGVNLRRIRGLAEFAWGVLRASRGLDYDVVVSDPPPTAALAASRAARRRRVPFVYYLADPWVAVASGNSSVSGGVVRRVIQGLEGSGLRAADLVVAVTDNFARIAREAGARNIEIVHNGIPVDVYRPDGDTWRPDDSGRPFFLYAGNAGVIHGAEVFAKAAAALWDDGADFDLVYMGYGMDLARVEGLAQVRPERVHLLPPQPPDVVAAALRGAVGALSSLRPIPEYADARTIKTLSGLAAGCPVVYVGDGDLAETIRAEGLGYVSEWSVDGARQSMQEALACHADCPEAEAKLRRQCADYARENFDERLGAERVAASVLALASGER